MLSEKGSKLSKFKILERGECGFLHARKPHYRLGFGLAADRGGVARVPIDRISYVAQQGIRQGHR